MGQFTSVQVGKRDDKESTQVKQSHQDGLFSKAIIPPIALAINKYLTAIETARFRGVNKELYISSDIVIGAFLLK